MSCERYFGSMIWNGMSGTSGVDGNWWRVRNPVGVGEGILAQATLGSRLMRQPLGYGDVTPLA